MKKTLLTILLAICLILQTAIPASAKDKSVSISACTLTTTSAVVTGTTEASAIMVRIKDADNNIIALQSFAVSSDKSFSASLEGISLTAGATYTVSVADYEGGSWATETITLSGTSTPDDNTGSTTTDNTVSTTPDDSSSTTPTPTPTVTPTPVVTPTPEPALEEIITDSTSETVTAVFDAGEIGEKAIEIPVVTDTKDEKSNTLLKAILTEEQQAAYKDTPVKLSLSVATTTLSSKEEKKCDENIKALETMIADSKQSENKIIIPDTLNNLFSGKLTAYDSGKDVTATPEIKPVATYDFSLSMQIGDNKAEAIHDLGTAKMEVNFKIDKKLLNTNANVKRIFLMLHFKEKGDTEVLPVNVDEKSANATVAFSSCSKFVLSYTDVARFTEAGTTLRSSEYNAKYTVIEGGDVSGKVGILEYIAPIKKKTKHTVYSKVTIDGITYKVTSIAANAFKNNTKITKIGIGSYVTSIGEKAFYGCSALEKVTMGKRVTTIGAKAFYKASALEEVIIKSKKLKAANIGESVWKKAGSENGITFTVPSSKVKSYTKLFGKFGTVQ
ncbi:MAG: leucine-rich repeat protein [Lachnospiraceae bacterium]|nr:leucine-rich repeat protein [Lachnospiraceae bacterium]